MDYSNMTPDQLQKLVSDLVTQIGREQVTLSDIQKQIEAENKAIGKKNEEIESKSKEINDLSAKLSELQGLVEDKKTELSEIVKEFNEKKKDGEEIIEGIGMEIEKKSSELTMANDALININSEIESATAEFDKRNGEEGKKILEMEELRSVLSDAINSLKEKKNNIEKEVETKMETLAEGSEKLVVLANNIASSRGIYADFENKIKEAQAELGQINDQIGESKKQVFEITNNIVMEKENLDSLIQKRMGIAQKDDYLRDKESYIEKMYLKAGIQYDKFQPE